MEIQVLWAEIPEIDQNGIITEYEVMYESLDETFGELTDEGLIVDSANLSITLMDLEEYVEYNISVRAYTSVGPGPYSVGIVRRTFEDGITNYYKALSHYYLLFFSQYPQLHLTISALL